MSSKNFSEMHANFRKCGVNSWNSSLLLEIKLIIGGNNTNCETLKIVQVNRGFSTILNGNFGIGFMLNSSPGD